MPLPRLQTIADIGYVFACMHDREPRGGCGYYDATGHYKPVTNTGWLLRNSHDIIDLWVSTHMYRSVAMGGGPPYAPASYERFDAMLAVRLTNGRVYVTEWQSADLLHDWLKRYKLSGRPIHWDCHSYIIGDRDYERLAWERRQRRERERQYNERTKVA